MTAKEKIKNLFTKHQKLVWNYIYSREIEVFSEELSSFPAQTKNEITLNSALSFIIIGIRQRSEKIKQLEEVHGKFLTGYPSKEQKAKTYLRNHFHYLSNIQDKKSWCFKPRYGWMDKEALEEKYYICVSSVKKEITALFNIAPAFLKNLHPEVPDRMLLSELAEVSIELIREESVWQLKQAALFFIKQILVEYRQQLNNELNETLVLIAIKTASNKDGNCWVRSEAVEILSILSEKKSFELARKIISEQSNDSTFLKRRLVNNIVSKIPARTEILNDLISDASEIVRQSIAENLPFVSQKDYSRFFNILINDEKTSVICQTIKSSFILLRDSDNTEMFETLISKLTPKGNKNPTLFLINSFSQYFKDLNKKNRSEFLNKLKIVVPALEKLRQNSEQLEIRRTSALVLEQLWREHNEQASELWHYISQKLEAKRPGKYIKLDQEVLHKYDDETIGRVLSVISQEDFSIQFVRSFFTVKLVKDAFYKFRLWRILFEFKNPSPNKRQALKNSYGRHFSSRIRSASSVMAEKSETGVPGEPVFFNDEGGCRHYLPLPDDILSASEASSVYKIFSPEGVTKITPPRNIFKKLTAEIKVIFSFDKLSKKRNIDTAGKTELQIKEYILTLRKAGYEISIAPYKKDEIFKPKPDLTVTRFFSLPLIIPSMPLRIFEDMKTYFFSLYLNTTSQLLFFVCIFIGFFTVKHFIIHSLFKKARKSIPLVIGGWGTRGKSSTERLKAAIFSSLGCNILSKTTGCEAAFLYSAQFDKLHEYPIFRPYEKTTIWEQYTLVRMASLLNIDIFLWECMAISPRYVKLMQRDWMKDDFSTITNTYPDHEDVQGPAGWNIAESMTNFIPEGATLITTEDQMHPFLKNYAKKLNTNFFRVTPMDIMLIPEEIISRFQYNEHPNNIALVAALAEKLGIEKDYALKEMCDNVIPDIGVLKRFQPLSINTKTLEFISGMSANEKYACIQNWTRMKMDSFNIEKNYGTLISTVVNNRADRVPRSRVFAKMLADDLSADYHFLVGTNLKGISGYIKNAWQSSLKNCSSANEEELMELFERKAAFLRIPKTETILKNRLKLMSNNSENKFGETSEAYKKMLQTYNEYIEFKNELASNVLPTNKLAAKCKILLTRWFYDKIIVLNNPKISGEEIIKHIEAQTPPYHKNIIMGIQNIKGPGINLINAWKKQTTDYRLQTTDQLANNSTLSTQHSALLTKYSSFVKTLFEPLSSVSKQRKAKSIYKAISSSTISFPRAIEELQKIKEIL